MSRVALHIDEENLSVAWAKALAALMEPGVGELSPLTVTVTGFDNGRPQEDHSIRCALDRALRDHQYSDSHTVANTVFPGSLWNPRRSRKRLYERYTAILPRIRKCPLNRYGVYFERLISYGQDRLNQLEYIIRTYRGGNHRRSALQAALIDPNVDHTNQRMRGFPCLQQVAFVPDGGNGLAITGYYPMQYLLRRGYGNYLGLCRLGRFVAQEMKLRLVQMTCFVNTGTLGASKKELQNLFGNVRDTVGEAD